jgi:hypothetical protein
MFCSNCGKQLIEGSKFCIHCGQPIETVATGQGVEATQPLSVPQPVQPTQPPEMAQQTAAQPVARPTVQSIPQTRPIIQAQPVPQPAPPPPEPQPGKKKTGLIIAIVVAAAVIFVAILAIIVAFLLVPSCSTNAKELPVVEEEQEEETVVDEEEPKDGDDSDTQGGNQEEPAEDDRLNAFEGTLHESTTLPLSFMLPPDYTVDENSDRIFCSSPTGLAQVQIYRVADISAADVQADQESYNLDVITRFNGNLYEYTSEEDVVHYGTTWHQVVFKSNDADGNLITYWLIYADDGKGGVIFCAYGLFFGPTGSVSADELSGLDIQESMKLD